MKKSRKIVIAEHCRNCSAYINHVCQPVYCYNCGDYYCPNIKHKCDPKQIKRHEAGMEAANVRGGEPDLRSPPYGQQLQDGFEMLDLEYNEQRD